MRCEEEVAQAIDKYGDMIRRICFIHLKKETDVDDIFQDVFIKYATKEITYASSEHEKAWFIRVSINECQSMLRRWFRQKVDLSDDLSKYGLETPAQHPEVLEAVLKLRDTYRNVVYLYYYEGYKITEIAEILNRSENTIHTWMKRAKQQLKEMLGGDPLA